MHIVTVMFDCIVHTSYRSVMRKSYRHTTLIVAPNSKFLFMVNLPNLAQFFLSNLLLIRII
jgi:hypothetical protein